MSKPPSVRRLIAALIALSIAGPFTAAHAVCTAGVCKVQVRVVNCDSDDGTQADPDPLVVPQPRGSKNIEWDLVTQGYEFTADGIVFKNNDGEFDQRQPGARKFKFRNRHTRRADYNYEIRVKKTGAGAPNCKSRDPVISNQ